MMDQAIKMLLIEDDEVDAEAVIRAFAKQEVHTVITAVSNGVEALEVMLNKERKDALAWPYLILLDLNMPRMNGLEFLHAIRQNPELKRSIVFMLTTSNQDEDKRAAYEEHVAGYFVKSKAGKDYVPITKLIELYWQLVEFPPKY